MCNKVEWHRKNALYTKKKQYGMVRYDKTAADFTKGKLESAWLVHVDRLEKGLLTSWMQVYKHLMMGRGKELLCNNIIVLHKNALITDEFHNY